MMTCSPLPVTKERTGPPREPGSSVLLGLERAVERLLMGGDIPIPGASRTRLRMGDHPFLCLSGNALLPLPETLGVRFRGHQ